MPLTINNEFTNFFIRSILGGIIGSLWGISLSFIQLGATFIDKKVLLILTFGMLGIVLWKFLSKLNLSNLLGLMILSVVIASFIIPTMLTAFSAPIVINWMLAFCLVTCLTLLIFSDLYVFKQLSNAMSQLKTPRRERLLTIAFLIGYWGCIIGMGPHLVSVNEDVTSFERAIRNEDIETIKMLLAQGIDVNIRNPRNHDTPLHWAATRNERITELLLQKGADIHTKNRDGRTALHEASFAGNAETIQLLITHGAKVNIRDRSGNTPLHLAALFTHVTAIKALLSYGAEVDIPNNLGKTPLKLALERKGNADAEQVIEFLHRYGATE